MLPCAVAACLVVACGGAPEVDLVTIDTLPGGVERVMTSSPVDSGAWRLEPLVRIQPGEGEPAELLNPASLALDDDGYLYVAEESDDPIKVFDPAGQFVRTLGRTGAGPGEYQAAFLAAGPGPGVAVHDPNASRTTWFGRDGSVGGMHTTACCNFGWIAMSNDGAAVIRGMTPPNDSSGRRQSRWHRAREDGAMDTVDVVHFTEEASQPVVRWEVREGERVRLSTGIPLWPFPNTFPARSGFYLGWPGEYEIRATRTGSDTTRLFGTTATRLAVSQAEKDRLAEEKVEQLAAQVQSISAQQMRAAFDPALIPDRQPAWLWLWEAADAAVWVQVPVRDTAVVALDRFDGRGVWVDRVLVPADRWGARQDLIVFGRDRVAVPVTAADGRPAIEVFRIVGPAD